jgi:hypothetical protein
LALLGAGLVFAGQTETSLRGKLVQRDGTPYLETGGKLVALEGEPESLEVLRDARLNGADLEVIGHSAAPGKFTVGPFFESKSMFVHKDGKKYTISYWCEVCSIRTYTPGLCMCCRDETELSLQEFKP